MPIFDREVSYFIVNKLKTSQNLKKGVQKLIFPRFFTTLLPFLTRTLTANNSIFSRGFFRNFAVIFLLFAGRRGRRPLQGIFAHGNKKLVIFLQQMAYEQPRAANNIRRGRRPRRPVSQTIICGKTSVNGPSRYLQANGRPLPVCGRRLHPDKPSVPTSCLNLNFLCRSKGKYTKSLTKQRNPEKTIDFMKET